MVSEQTTLPKAAHKSIRIGEDGAPWIEAYRCDNCSAVVPVATLACRSCASRTPPHGFRSARTGILHTWSIVHRSYPGIPVPFVSAIVDLDDGLSIKGTLRGVSPDDVREAMAVKLVFDDAGGATDPEGAPYLGFHFAPAGDAA